MEGNSANARLCHNYRLRSPHAAFSLRERDLHRSLYRQTLRELRQPGHRRSPHPRSPMRRVAAVALTPLRSPLPGCGFARGVFQDGPARRWRAGLSIPSGPDLWSVRQEISALLPSRSVSCTPADARPVQLKMLRPAAVSPAGASWNEGPAFPESGRGFRSWRAGTCRPSVESWG